ncbi:MAG TPA: hypothetical protein VHO68_12535 [Bacteroidales bacterium]|nr:hypothetical protein [Bacteroidales bacterium]
MDRKEIRLLFNYLVSNSKHLTPLQEEYMLSLKEQYSLTGVLTKRQIESLVEIKEFIPSNTSEEPDQAYEYQAQYSGFDYGTSISAYYE